MRLAEELSSEGHAVSVIMQDHVGIKQKLVEENRGAGVDFYPAKAFSNSGSGVPTRVFDALFFAIWVLRVLFVTRPRTVYVSTDPPVAVPSVVMVYCWLFHAEYIYHLQDIHPEAINVVMPINRWVLLSLVRIDSLTMRRARRLITITTEMAAQIQARSGTPKRIDIISNPAVSFDGIDIKKPKRLGFSFCGNAGRLQRIPLLLAAIEEYFRRGGTLEFIFAGDGVFADRLKRLANLYPEFNYRGLVLPTEAAQISADYVWALLPIEDEVTRYAFPSKTSSYALAGASILAVCGSDTVIADWVTKNGVGIVVNPEEDALVDAFFDIQNGHLIASTNEVRRQRLMQELTFERFVEKLRGVILE